MYRKFILALLVSASTIAQAQSKKEMEAEIARLKAKVEALKKPKELNFTNHHTKASYALGTLMASNVLSQGADSLDADALSLGLRDAIAKQPLKVEENEAMMIVQSYMQEAMMNKSVKAREAGVRFLEENKSKEGVTTTASGLQYKVLQQGTGRQPGANDRVTVHYTGTLIDGTVFDSSVKRGQPATFNVGGVIRGWTEALQLMKEGDRWMLYIPFELGYGERGSPPKIPPYSTLLFEVELIKVN